MRGIPVNEFYGLRAIDSRRFCIKLGSIKAILCRNHSTISPSTPQQKVKVDHYWPKGQFQMNIDGQYLRNWARRDLALSISSKSVKLLRANQFKSTLTEVSTTRLREYSRGRTSFILSSFESSILRIEPSRVTRR